MLHFRYFYFCVFFRLFLFLVLFLHFFFVCLKKFAFFFWNKKTNQRRLQAWQNDTWVQELHLSWIQAKRLSKSYSNPFSFSFFFALFWWFYVRGWGLLHERSVASQKKGQKKGKKNLILTHRQNMVARYKREYLFRDFIGSVTRIPYNNMGKHAMDRHMLCWCFSIVYIAWDWRSFRMCHRNKC